MNRALINATDLLPVAKRFTPTTEQAAGHCCVWCGGIASVDLGPRLRIADGGLQRWRPRACRTCVVGVAEKRHGTHRETCARCTPWEHCRDSHALYALAHGHPDGLIRDI
ncbi:hypothetical protein [Streptomyces sp. NPDC047042]|uniref:hypothetical protein n=1 Tax=Streptomyces sp. NPDC047042 TaxID=3154807 RepID=UPI0033C45E88